MLCQLPLVSPKATENVLVKRSGTGVAVVFPADMWSTGAQLELQTPGRGPAQGPRLLWEPGLAAVALHALSALLCVPVIF